MGVNNKFELLKYCRQNTIKRELVKGNTCSIVTVYHLQDTGKFLLAVYWRVFYNSRSTQLLCLNSTNPSSVT